MKPAPNIPQATIDVMAAREWLHIYAQPFEHHDAVVMGTRSALTGLRDAIDRALQSGMDQTAKGIVSDGEGFYVEVKIRSMEALDAEPLPYAELVYQEDSK